MRWMMWVKRAAAGAALFVLLGLVACGRPTGGAGEAGSGASAPAEAPAAPGPAAGEKPSGAKAIGITQIVEHPSLDAIREGILEGLAEAGYVEGKTLQVDYENAQGDRSIATAIAEKFAASPLDLVIAITTTSAQAVKEAVTDKPIVFAAVTDPVAAGLVEALDRPGERITGSSDQTPVDLELDLIRKVLPDARTIGIVYHSGEVNAEAQLRATEAAARDRGLAIEKRGVTAAAEVPQAVASIARRVDAFLILNDNLVVSAADAYLDAAGEARKPVFASDPDTVAKGAVATYGIDQRALGRRTGEIAARILDGTPPSAIPVLVVRDTELVVNRRALERLGIVLPAALEAEVKVAY
ncbi:ABC transporter substrate-binding protein [Hydrogenibacillus schlegelii]|uniref:ABC transporter substrate-binding protein n=3 Tax=Hydrogenibacillus schlegelii TaxID=1484 RepID=A0A179ILM9_HYDSH|nr:ABC transporter substrate-binding protein [Hydrogenibacillus schlegelii]OAR03576.1 hypothetical protein SA87_02780 [Hydrogenibacillus schlegelii]